MIDGIHLDSIWIFPVLSAAIAHGAVCTMQATGSDQALAIQLAQDTLDLKRDSERLLIHRVLVNYGVYFNLNNKNHDPCNVMFMYLYSECFPSPQKNLI